MLIQTDIAELGDKRLSPEEAVAKEREELLAIEAKKKVSGQKEMEDPDRAGGHKLYWPDFLRILLTLNPTIRPRDGMEGSIALYILKHPTERLEGDHYGEVPPGGVFFIDHKYVTGFPKRQLSEWSTVTLDTSKVAVREQRSWRSVLLALIKARAITVEQANAAFGDPIHDRRAYRDGGWFDQIKRFKEKKCHSN